MASHTKFVITFASLIAGFAVTSVWAQESTGPVIEEIVVTAQKREQSIVDVPIAMTALTVDQIEKTRAKTIADIEALAPNFSFEKVNGFDNISLRGVGGGGRSIGFDPRSGLYIDGVYIGQAAALSQPLFGIERVEILRGPQGHLFGRNTVSGAVSLTTQGPSEEFEGSFSAVAGNENAYEVSGSIGGPLGENIFTKISASYETRDGFGTNIFDGKDINDLERTAFRGQLRFNANERLTVDIFADYSETEKASPVGEAQTTGLFSAGAVYPSPERKVNTNSTPQDDSEIGGVSITANYDMDNGYSITSISAFRFADAERVNDTDYSPLDALNIFFTDESDQLSQEFRFISPDDKSLRYVLGLYFLNEDADTARIAHLGTAIGGPLDILIDSNVETSTYAAFASVDYDLLDNLTLNLGARFTSEDKDLDYSMANGFVLGLAGTAPFNPLVTVRDDISETQFTPMIGLTWAINESINLYTKYTIDGFKSGGFNNEFVSDATVAAGLVFDPETVDSFEVGIKGAFADGRVSFDAAVFVATYDDFQILQFIEVGPGLTDIQLRNAAEVETRGIEVAAKFAVTENLLLGINAAKLDAEFDSFPNAAGVGVDFDGNELPNAPDFTGALTIDYQIPLQSLGGVVDIYGEYSYRAESFSLANNDPVNARLPSRKLLNARITYSPSSANWSFGLWARNLLDEDTITLRVRDFLGNELLKRGDPVTWGAEFKMNF